jgi:peroxiredoxin
MRITTISIITGMVAALSLAASVGLAESESQEQLFELAEVPDKPEAADFTLPDTDGNEHTLSSYRGKPVILNFWATWCRPCRAEMPALQRAWEKVRGEGVMLLAVNMGDRPDWIPKFREALSVQLDFPILLDPRNTLAKPWAIKGLPLTYIIDPEGRLVYYASGEREWDDQAILEKVLALKSE